MLCRVVTSTFCAAVVPIGRATDKDAFHTNGRPYNLVVDNSKSLVKALIKHKAQGPSHMAALLKTHPPASRSGIAAPLWQVLRAFATLAPPAPAAGEAAAKSWFGGVYAVRRCACACVCAEQAFNPVGSTAIGLMRQGYLPNAPNGIAGCSCKHGPPNTPPKPSPANWTECLLNFLRARANLAE